MRRLRLLLASGTVAASLGASVACSSILGIDDSELPGLDASTIGQAGDGGDASVVGSPDGSADGSPGDGAMATMADAGPPPIGAPQVVTGSPGEEFGASVALSADGRFLAVGAPATGDALVQAPTYRRGAVHLYERDDAGVYSESAKPLVPGDFGQEGGAFGQTLAFSLDGTLLAVGAPHSQYLTSGDVGSVFLYSFAPEAGWATYTSMVPNFYKGSGFGSALAFGNPIDPSRYGAQLYVGAPGSLASGVLGSIYSYAYNAASSPGHFRQQIDSPDDAGDLFGARLAATAASTVFVGAPGPTSPGGGGASFVVDVSDPDASDLEAGIPAPHLHLIGIAAGAGNDVGTAVAVTTDGARLVISGVGQVVNGTAAPLGQVFPFSSDGGGGARAYTALSGGAASTYGFGAALAVSSRSLAIGDPFATVSQLTGAGLVSVVEGSFAPGLVTVLQATTASASAYFGASVACTPEGAVLAVGAPGTSGTAGNVYIYAN